VQTDGICSYNKLASVISNTQVEKVSKFQPKAEACLKADTWLYFRKNQMPSVLAAVTCHNSQDPLGTGTALMNSLYVLGWLSLSPGWT